MLGVQREEVAQMGYCRPFADQAGRGPAQCVGYTLELAQSVEQSNELAYVDLTGRGQDHKSNATDHYRGLLILLLLSDILKAVWRRPRSISATWRSKTPRQSPMRWSARPKRRSSGPVSRLDRRPDQ